MPLIRLSALVLAIALCISGPPPAARAGQPLFRVGVLVSLTGEWSTLGRNTAAALEIAAEKLNQQSPGAERVELVVRDTRLDPQAALGALKELRDSGVVAVIGPQSSDELAPIKTYADDRGVVIVSQSSTASSLAYAGDNVFRFCPTDKHEAAAVTALMWREGVRTVVPVWRNDVGNRDMHDSFRKAFTALGGVVTAGVRYQPVTTDFSSVVNDAAAQVTKDATAIYLTGFDEVAKLFHAARTNATLSRLRWYGSDGVALSHVLRDDTVAAAFAAQVGYPNPIFGLDDALRSRWEPIAAAVERRTGTRPDAFALSAYDALFVIQRALKITGDTKNFAAFRSAFIDAANAYSGVTGSTALDASGDRHSANFNFWALRPMNGRYAWVRVGRHATGTSD